MRSSNSGKPILVIANKNYSSWSLRPWLLLRQFGIGFDEIKLPLDTPEFYERIRQYSPAMRVPVLIDNDPADGEVRVWDSLAICEYANERWLDGRAWPADRAVRAQARAISAEMHAGFSALRNALPMNCRKRVARPALGDDVQSDIARIRSMWREAREHNVAAGPFLFGTFSIADAMYAPVAIRFASYAIGLDEIEQEYVDMLIALPAMREWFTEAATEPLAPLHERNSA